MPQRLRLLLLIVFTLLTPSFASAQQTSASAGGPRVERTAIAMRHAPQPVNGIELFQRARRSTGKPIALMIVGGAAIILGAIIGDSPGTLFMIGGAGVLLYGLYLYLQ